MQLALSVKAYEFRKERGRSSSFLTDTGISPSCSILYFFQLSQEERMDALYTTQ